MQISEKGLSLIAYYEGLKVSPYLDAVGIPTIGLGTIVYPDGKKVTMADPPITKEQAYDFCKDHLKGISESLTNFLEKIEFAVEQNEFDALLCFAYNLGMAPILNKGKTMHEALCERHRGKIRDAFLIYNRAGGKILRGLTRRRRSESILFAENKIDT